MILQQWFGSCYVNYGIKVKKKTTSDWKEVRAVHYIHSLLCASLQLVLNVNVYQITLIWIAHFISEPNDKTLTLAFIGTLHEECIEESIVNHLLTVLHQCDNVAGV